MNVTVRKGDTLSAIARRYGTSVRELLAANRKVRNPSLICPGDQLCLPGRPTGPAPSRAKATPAARAIPSGGLDSWIREAVGILRAHGIGARQATEGQIAAIVRHESGGDPHAQNNWDSNAKAGHPSKGLMQTIESTFRAYALPGFGNIWHPVDNIIAGVRYAVDNYGSLANTPGLRAVSRGRQYQGY